MITKNDITYKQLHFTAIIPKGTTVVPCTNLPDDHPEQGKRYWCQPWEGMTEQEESWHRNYGFLLNTSEVCKELYLIDMERAANDIADVASFAINRAATHIAGTKYAAQGILELVVDRLKEKI